MSTPSTNNEFLISASISTADMARDLQTGMRRAAQAVSGEKIQAVVEFKAESAGLKKKMQELRGELEGVTKKVSEAEEEFSDMQKAVSEAGKSLEKALPGAADRMAKAIEKGVDAAREEIQSLKKEWEDALGPRKDYGKMFSKSLDNVKTSQLRRAKEILRGKKLEGKYDEAGLEEVGTAMISRLDKRLKNISDLRKSLREMSPAERSTATGQQNLSTLETALQREIQAARKARADIHEFYGDPAMARRGLSAYRGMNSQGVNARDFAPLEKLLTSFIAQIAKIQDSGAYLADTKGQQSSILNELRSVGMSRAEILRNARDANRLARANRGTGGGSGTGVSGGTVNGTFGVNIDIPDLIAQIKRAFEHEYQLRIDQDHLKAQIQAAGALSGTATGEGAFTRILSATVAQINNLGVMAARAADALTKGWIPDAAIEERSMKRRERRKRDRDAERALMVDKQAAHDAGKNFEDGSKFLKSIGAGHLVPLLDKATGYKRVAEGTADHDAATKAALDVASELRKQVHAFEGSSASSAQKELMKTFGTSVFAEFLTPLENRVKRVREVGPNPFSKGSLSGVDRLHDGIVKEWQQRRMGDIQRQMDEFSGFSANFKDNRFRNPFAESERAYKHYAETRYRYENAFRAFSEAMTDQERVAAGERLSAAKEELQYAQDMLRYRVLANSGNITVGGQVKTKTLARAEAVKNLRGGLEDQYNSIASARGGTSLFSFDQFTRGLFSGDRGLAKEFLKAKGLSDDMVNNELLLLRHLETHIGKLRDQYAIQKKIDSEIEQQVKHIALAQQMRGGGGGGGGMGGGYGRTIRNAWGMFGIGLGASAAWQIRGQMQQYMQYQQEVAGIQGVLKSRNPNDAQNMSDAIGKTAGKYGANLIETAQAARVLAQSGFDATEIMKELDYTLMAQKGMGMTAEQVQNLQVAIRAVTQDNEKFNQSLSWTASVLEKISAVEARYAVESKDLADAITILSPVVEQFSGNMTGLVDVFDQVNGMTTVIVKQLRVTGTQAANAMKMVFSRLARPEILEKLQSKYGANLGTKDGKDLLPLDELMPSLARRYQELSKTDPLKAKQFAVELSGGRQSNQIIALLDKYQEAQEIAIQSSYAWGSAQERAAIAGDTMATALGRLNTNFQLFVKNTLEGSSSLGRGITATMNGMAGLMGGISGTGGGGGTLMGLIMGGGAAFSAGKGLYDVMSKGRHIKDWGNRGSVAAALGDSGALTGLGKKFAEVAATGSRMGKVIGGLGGVFSTLARWFTPGGVLLTGVLLLIQGIGMLAGAGDNAATSLDRYITKVRTLEDLKVFDAPQMKQFEDTFAGKESMFGFGSAKFAYMKAMDGMQSGAVANTSAGSLLGKTDAELKEFFKNAAPQEIKKFQMEFAKVFIDQLPADARKGFMAIEDDQQRLGKVAEMVGGAAFAANVQIASAVDAIRESTLRMVQDSITAIDELDSSARKTWIAKQWGALKDGFTGNNLESGGYVTVGTKSGRDAIGRRVTDVMDGIEDMPLFSTDGLNDKQAKQFRAQLEKELANVATSLAQTKGAPGQAVYLNNGEILNAFLTRAENVRGSFAQTAISSAAYRAAGQGEKATQLIGGFLGDKTVSEADKARGTLTRIGVKLQEEVGNTMKKELQGQLPGSRVAEILDRLMKQRTGVDGTKAITGAAGTGTREALIQFKDTLLDVVLAMHEALVRIQSEERFANKFGLAYDKSDAYMQFGRNLIMQGEGYKADRMTDIARAMNEIPNIRTQFSRLDGEQVSVRAQREEELGKQILDRRDELKRFSSENLAEVLKNTDGSVLREINGLLSQVDGASAASLTNLEKAMQLIGEAFVNASQKMSLAKKQVLQDTEFYRMSLEKAVALEEASLPITAKNIDKLRVKAKGQDMILAEEIRALDVQLREKAISEEQYKLDVRRLEANHAITQAYEARMAVIDAENALSAQVMANIEASVAPIRSLLTDPSVWEGVQTWEQASDVLLGTMGKIAQTFNERIFDNVFKKITDKLFDSALGGLMAMPETMLQESLVGARQFESGILSGSAVGAQMMAQAIAGAAGAAGAAQAGSGIPGALGKEVDASLQGGYDAARASVAEGKAKLDAQFGAEALKSQNKKMMWTSGGMMVGQIGGTLMGGGGKNAQMGSSIGSTVGMLGAAGLAKLGGSLGVVGGPIGMAVGAALGGLLGGFLGGKSDKKKDPAQQETSRGLEAIERAQRETITAIQTQTDALLKPENRLLNLPSTFNIPNFAPNFGGSGGGMGGGTLDLNINISGSAPAELQSQIADAVQEAMEQNLGNLLSNQRGTRSWG